MSEIQPTTQTLTIPDTDRQQRVGAAVDQAAQSGVFADYQQRRAANTLRHSWATRAARAKTDAFALQEGAWNSLAMPLAATSKRRRLPMKG